MAMTKKFHSQFPSKSKFFISALLCIYRKLYVLSVYNTYGYFMSYLAQHPIYYNKYKTQNEFHLFHGRLPYDKCTLYEKRNHSRTSIFFSKLDIRVLLLWLFIQIGIPYRFVCLFVDFNLKILLSNLLIVNGSQ